MNFPVPGDYINIHSHGDTPAIGVFTVENLMAHEGVMPSDKGVAWSFGIHPWFLNENNHSLLIKSVRDIAGDPLLSAIGEAGFDKIKGPEMKLQISTFEAQVEIAEEFNKPLVIHCVKAWDELIASHKKLKPSTPWLIHGFHGKKELASQLLSRGMYLSIWYSFALIPESAELIRFIPRDRLFLETDGSDVDIMDIYNKVAEDLKMNITDLKSMIFENFNEFFALKL